MFADQAVCPQRGSRERHALSGFADDEELGKA